MQDGTCHGSPNQKCGGTDPTPTPTPPASTGGGECSAAPWGGATSQDMCCYFKGDGASPADCEALGCHYWMMGGGQMSKTCHAVPKPSALSVEKEEVSVLRD